MRRAIIRKSIFVLIVTALGWRVQASTIAEIKAIDATGKPVNAGKTFTVTGVVTVPSKTFNTRNLDAYIQDQTGGIWVYKRSWTGIDLFLGDSVSVTGLVTINTNPTDPRCGTTYISATSIEVLGKSLPLEPVILDAREAFKPASPPQEFYEGMLIAIRCDSLDSSQWPRSGDANITVFADDTSFTIRIDGDTDIDGSEPPEIPVLIIGVVNQSDRNEPYLTGYTLWPRWRRDFLRTGSGSGFADVKPASVEIDHIFDLVVTLRGNGVDTITSFEIDLPLEDGWIWQHQEVRLVGPGLEGAKYERTDKGVRVENSAIASSSTYGSITFIDVRSPDREVVSKLDVRTSVDGSSRPIEYQPEIRSLRPITGLIISEVFPNDAVTGQSNAFIEIHNKADIPVNLKGLVLCEVSPGLRCMQAVKMIFAEDFEVKPDSFVVIAESAEGFKNRFGFDPDFVAPISPLGRISGDGATSAGIPSYETISLWRDQTLSILMDYLEYKDAVLWQTDLCEEFEGSAFPLIPPVGYSLINHLSGEPYPDYNCALTGKPTPRGENEIDYLPIMVTEVVSHSTDIIEIYFSEPLRQVSASCFKINGQDIRSVFRSLSNEKILLYFDDQPPGQATLEIKEIAGLGKQQLDTTFSVTITSLVAEKGYTIQDFDEIGFSPLNGKSVTMIGFVTVPPGIFQPAYSSMYVQALDGCGVNVFSYDVPSPRPALGDLVRVVGDVKEYVGASAGSTTEIFMSSPQGMSILSRYYPEPEPVLLHTGEIGKEINEGKLLETSGSVLRTSANSFYIDDGTGGIQIYQNFTTIDFSRYRVGMYVRVRGVVLQYDYTKPFLEGYELVPRFESDLEIIEDAFPEKTFVSGAPQVFCPSCGDNTYPIRFGARSRSWVFLQIFDVAGREIRVLYRGDSVGEQVIEWDGKDSRGREVSPGLYICCVQTTDFITGKESIETIPIVVGVTLK